MVRPVTDNLSQSDAFINLGVLFHSPLFPKVGVAAEERMTMHIDSVYIMPAGGRNVCVTQVRTPVFRTVKRKHAAESYWTSEAAHYYKSCLTKSSW